jgi:hypothetical protein
MTTNQKMKMMKFGYGNFIHTNDPVANASERRRRRSESEHERKGQNLFLDAIFYPWTTPVMYGGFVLYFTNDHVYGYKMTENLETDKLGRILKRQEGSQNLLVYK